ncbi:MAG: amidophosphoribosyltransferase [Deltaproteobacteria bacterium]|nr:amidophosphoribosyltransferase [Deltaproteobacteria bacterium]
MDKFKEECGVFGIWNHTEASNMTYLGLYALQHRGQEGCGIVSLHNNELVLKKGKGLVADNFDEESLRKLKGLASIGHVRYSTTQAHDVADVQPLMASFQGSFLALAHNGNLTNAKKLRDELESDGAIFQSHSDTEIFLHLIAKSKKINFKEKVIEALQKVEGAFSLIILTKHGLLVARDSYGFRPLVLGRLPNVIPARSAKRNSGDLKNEVTYSYVIASETCAFDLIGAESIREIEKGELLDIRDDGLHSIQAITETPQKSCIFEYVYFARPDSEVYGQNVYEIRRNMGQRLARERPVEADMVIPVPDSGVPAAIGYAQTSGIPYDMGIIRNHYVGRTFIEPQQSIRHFGVKVKLNAVRKVIEGKRLIVIDDSLVRGTTSRKIIKMLRDNGAKEVHMRISSPPTTHSCFYGIDTPTREELIASSQSIEEIRKYISADSLAYLSKEGMIEAASQKTYLVGEGAPPCHSREGGNPEILDPVSRFTRTGLGIFNLTLSKIPSTGLASFYLS